MKTRLVMLICISVFSARGWSQSERHWENYKARTLQSIIEMHHDAFDGLDSSKKHIIFLSSDSFPSQVKLTYLVKSRPLPADKKELLDGWSRAYQQPRAAELFAQEVLFKEGGDEYWIAVQKPVLDALPKEVKKKQSVNVYLIFMGGTQRVGEQIEWLFAINEFDTP